MKNIQNILAVALDRTHIGDKGFEFEQFCQNLGRCQYGKDFFATSPFKDGGIDGFIIRNSNDELVITKKNNSSFIFQFGTTSDFESKIRSTILDLRKNNITIQKLSYFTPHRISNIVAKVNALEEELEIALTITDQSQLCTMAANGECTKIFETFITSILGCLEISDSKNITYDYPVLYLNTWFKTQNNGKEQKIIQNMADSLIIWALRDTDPTNKTFLTEQKIYETIEKSFPTAKQFIKGIFQSRLDFLQKQRTYFGRQSIQKHPINNFCLPLETRNKYREEEANSEQILILVKNSFLQRLLSNNQVESNRGQLIAEFMLYVIKNLFETKGIRFVEAITNTRDNDIAYDELYLLDCAKNANNELLEFNFLQKEQQLAIATLREVFVQPTEYELEYLNRASHLYIMHYIMHNDIGIANYFTNKVEHLHFIVHSDILIRALSEEFLPFSGQHYRNMLHYLKEAGAKLIITEEALVEILMNLRIGSFEYMNNIKLFEDHFCFETIKYLPVLITRSYLFSKLDKKVNSWQEFINRFCTYNTLLNNEIKAKEELLIYFIDKYKLEFLKTSDIKKDIDLKLADQLSEIITPYKKKVELARHVAKINIYIDTIRHRNKEISENPFGYKTYWLTHEKTVFNIAKDFFKEHGLNQRLIMRPEYIMQQIMFMPDKNQISTTYSSTFPTALGIQISQQLDPNIFHALMNKLQEINKQDPSRTKAMLHESIQVAAEETVTQVASLEWYDTSDFPALGNFNNPTIHEQISKILSKAEERISKQK